MVKDLYDWATGSETTQPVGWLYGPAGAGKSAVMQTLARQLQANNRLGGSFFFKRGHTTRGHAEALFVTLAYQLALHNDALKNQISQIVNEDSSITKQNMKDQLRKLIVEPYAKLKEEEKNAVRAFILLVDGLDECDNKLAQKEVLRLIQDVASEPNTALRFLVASRPESHIREALGPNLRPTIRSFNIRQSFDDVRTYFQDNFERIHHDHEKTMRSIPTPWPPEKVMKALVEKSSGYFIYAATVIKFVDDEYAIPTERLAIIQKLIPVPSGDESPFAPLDQLYTQILNVIPSRLHATLREFLYVVAALPDTFDAGEIDVLLGSEGKAALILRGLQSLLNEGTRKRISSAHASFLDFLRDPARSTSFYTGSCGLKVAKKILKVLAIPFFTTEHSIESLSVAQPSRK
ncbi:hypothetical protein B0H14DRAFT_736986 [Mycena olivaceomarginata]|nr:hypothetical protein B0H14DRAFT_736986 [Mycena olivaceomarginata]